MSNGSVHHVYSAAGTMISAFGNTGAFVLLSSNPKIWSGWKCETRIVSIRLGSMPADRILAIILPETNTDCGLKACT